MSSHTRKEPKERVRVRGTPQTLKRSTVSRNILKQIREAQNDLYKNMNVKPNQVTGNNRSLNDDFLSDFDKSKVYLESLANSRPSLNASLKRQTPMRDVDQMSESSELNCPITRQNTLYNQTGAGSPSPSPISDLPTNSTYHYALNQQQAHGCLKGGVLPTYRTWKNEQPSTSALLPAGLDPPITEKSVDKQKMSEILQMKTLKDVETHLFPPGSTLLKVSDIPQKRQKRTLRRTHHVGKSKHYKKIGVLVSNKTLRNQTTEKMNQIKQTPIAEIRKHLVKRGLIKVGSNAPHDVLRKMYESVSLIVGDVMNHNTDNLLHNYMHGSGEN